MTEYKRNKIEELQEQRSQLKLREDLTKEQLLTKDKELVEQIKKIMGKV